MTRLWADPMVLVVAVRLWGLWLMVVAWCAVIAAAVIAAVYYAGEIRWPDEPGR